MKSLLSSITLPDYSENIKSIAGEIKKLPQLIVTFFSTFGETSAKSFNFPSRGIQFNNYKRFMKKSYFLPALVITGIVVLLIFVVVRSTNETTATSRIGDNRLSLERAKARQSINKTLTFPLKDQAGKEISRLKFTVIDAEKRDDITSKGKRYIATDNRTYLILNLKVTNDYSRAVELQLTDYFRLQMNDSKEKLAPELHNDPVRVHADSTKNTRVGYAVRDSDKKLILFVGEIDGKKEEISLSL